MTLEKPTDSPPMAHQLPEWEDAPPPSLPPPPVADVAPKPSFITKHTRFSSQPAITKEVPPIEPSNYPRPTFQERFDRIFPPHRTYFGRNRRIFLTGLTILLFCLLALILGLAIGLSRSKDSYVFPSLNCAPPHPALHPISNLQPPTLSTL
jgi:hypothetical protein